MAEVLAGIAAGVVGTVLLAGIGVAAWWDRHRQPEPTMGLVDR